MAFLLCSLMAEVVISGHYTCSWLQMLGSKDCILPYSQAVATIFLLVLHIISLQISHWPLWTFMQQLLHNRSAWKLTFGTYFTKICQCFIFPPEYVSSKYFLLISSSSSWVLFLAFSSPEHLSLPQSVLQTYLAKALPFSFTAKLHFSAQISTYSSCVILK